MKYPACGAAELVRDTRDTPYMYKGESTTLPAVNGDFCLACGEAVLDAKESRRINTLMREFNQQVNAAIVDPAFIMTVHQAVQIFGGGVNAFSRYENGKTKAPLALVKLLRVLDRNPELLAEVTA
jgi:HTH-type transcriptional regulator / antitoxin MqsA